MFGIGTWEMILIAVVVVVIAVPILVAVLGAATAAYLDRKKE
jgi:hypothetical protein